MFWVVIAILASECFGLSPLPSAVPYVITNSTELPHNYGYDFNVSYDPELAEDKAIKENVIKDLLVQVRYVSADVVRVRITDANDTRWQVPDVVNITQYHNGTLHFNVAFTFTPFSLKVTRLSDNATILNIDPSQTFQFDDQDMILTNLFNKPTDFYGIGERVTPTFKLAPGIYTTFNKDAASPVDYGRWPGSNMYGTHPFYLGVDNTSIRATGGFLLNCNAMDTTVHDDYIAFRTIGGVLDFFGFIGPDIQSVIKQYHSLIGQPVLAPYWSLGWHQSKWGYNDTTELGWVVGNYTKNDLPLDVLWSDIEYMDSNMDFTIDSVHYGDLPSFVSSLHNMSKFFVPILESGIPNVTYVPYTNGTDMHVFMNAPSGTGLYVGKGWPGSAVFVDWSHPNATIYWKSMLEYFHEMVPYDGLWLNMNEVSNFCNGECDGQPVFNSSDLPYLPGNVSLNIKAIDLAVRHYNNVTEYDFHSFYGFYQAKATSEYFQHSLNKRPFIDTRSTLAGNGRYAQHSLGDNWSSWDFLEYSIIGIYNFQMFGIPIVGADICGHSNSTTPELCARWMQLGTVYPYARNHNTRNVVTQEPYALGDMVLRTSQLSIRNRYYLLNYLYTLFFTHAKHGGVWFKPAFFEYPNDRSLRELHVSDNFMLGRSLLVHPVLAPNTTSIAAYFPMDYWYDLYSGQFLDVSSSQLVALNVTLPSRIPIHVRGGSIIPTLDLHSTAMNVIDLRRSNTTLLVALDAFGMAQGMLVIDDGKSLDSLTGGVYCMLEFSYFPYQSDLDVLEVLHVRSGYDLAAGEFSYISNIEIFGCSRQPYQVFYHHTTARHLLDTDIVYNPARKVCRIGLIGGLALPRLASQGVFYISYSP
jgi:alpha-glucosidase (family GH31 glycosyl hydrolase)